MTYEIEKLENDIYVVFEKSKNWRQPAKAVTAAFDTETLTYIDGKIKSNRYIFNKLKGCTDNEKRQRLRCNVWAWQCYDEQNGFFMTNDFETFVTYHAIAGYKHVWCYNATFDFAQIDYKILVENKEKWNQHKRKDKNSKAYNKSQPWTYESLHSAEGARYSYKLWVPYRDPVNRHKHVHACDYRDFMKILPGGLERLLNELDVEDLEGNKIRKLKMDYQNVKVEKLTQDELNYCCNDVKGLYFAIKKFDKTIKDQTGGECSIFGNGTNVMTAGGLAKAELLRSMYPIEKNKRERVKRYQKEHPVTEAQDKFYRKSYLYRGAICTLNKKYKGKLLTKKLFKRTMNRYDVNSEYPFAMDSIQDLEGLPLTMTMQYYLAHKKEYKKDYEVIFLCNHITGFLRNGMIASWYDCRLKEYVEIIEEDYRHCLFEDELDEYEKWYDLEYSVEKVILYKKGQYVFRNFVRNNFEKKNKAKRENLAALSKFSKLLLNSAYGKLAERIEKKTGHYEENPETGCVHFVEDETETSASSMLSVVVGSKITSFARCYILSKIREICGCDKNGKSLVAEKFVYIDTDSIHAFADYKGDAFKLGELKCEAECEAVKYIMPKTYIDIDSIENGIVKSYEIHSKGLATSIVTKKLQQYKKLTLKRIDKIFNYGQKFMTLQAMNVRGGKVLIPVEKYLARPECAEGLFLESGYDGTFLNER